MSDTISTIVLADDHPLMRKGLKEIIAEDGSFTIVAETNNGESAVEMAEQHRPDIAVLDIDMPKMNGLEAAALLARRKSRTRIIIMTMYDTENMFLRAMEIGVMGYVLKESAATEIVDALRTVREGRHYITPSLSGALLRYTDAVSARSADRTALTVLTPTERKVLSLIAQEKTSREIADLLFVSPRTIDTHRNNICQKMDLHGANALLKFALEHKQHL